MKSCSLLVPAAIVSMAWAQNSSSWSSSWSSEVTVTEYTYSDFCPETDTITSTYCDECTHTESWPLTTYTTVYKEWCPTGLADKTWTITESCKTPGMPRPTDHVPQGFGVVTEKCPVCETEMTAVLTTPMASATGGMAPTPAPMSRAPAPAPSAAPGTPGTPPMPAQSPAAPASMPSPAGSMPPAPGQPMPQGYTAPNGTAGTCETCRSSNSTSSPPIKAAKAPCVSPSILVAVAAVFAAALFTTS